MIQEEDVYHKIDIMGQVCPYTFIRAKLALEKIGLNEILEIYLDNRMALKHIPQAFIYQGQEYSGTESVSDNEWIIRIRRWE